MKTVLFDLMVSQPVAGSKFHGGGEYVKTVFQKLCLDYLSNIRLIVFYDPKRYLDDWIYEIIRKNRIITYEVHDYSEVRKIPEFSDVNVFFAGLMTGLRTLNFPSNTKVIGIYHGFRSLELPIEKTAPLYENTIKGKVKVYTKLLMGRYYYNRKYKDMKGLISKCTYIVGVSEHSGYAAQVFFPDFPMDKIKVYYSPPKYIETVPGIDEIKKEKFVLMLGGNRWEKNIYRGILALDGLFSKRKMDEYNVRIVGGIPRDILRKIKNKDRFISLDYLSTENLEKTYKACDIFFYPTLNEGFGCPPLEAMKYGTTCVISAVNSLPEIYKDSVYYCNPYDISEMQGRLLQAAENKIPEIAISKHVKYIGDKQRKDLENLCKLIADPTGFSNENERGYKNADNTKNNPLLLVRGGASSLIL